MELTTFLILGGTFVFILILWSAVGIRHLSEISKIVSGKRENLLDLLRKRCDLVPNLVETVRYNTDEYGTLLEGLIHLRQKAVRVVDIDLKKKEVENDFHKKLEEVINAAWALPELARDTNFLELKTEFDELDIKLVKAVDEYNKSVFLYEKNRDFFVLKPLAFIFRYGVFEKF